MISHIRQFAWKHRLPLLVFSEALLFAVLALFPTDRMVWLLENALTLVAAGVLLETRHRFRFSTGAYALIFLFLALHAYGAHHSYGAVPVPWVNDLFGRGRNNYDRLVHLASGLLLLIPVRELLMRGAGVPARWAGLLGAVVIVAGGAGYECIEMAAAQVFAPGLADDFLAMQGDLWDAQKDMAMQMLGCSILLAGQAVAIRLRRQPSLPETLRRTGT